MNVFEQAKKIMAGGQIPGCQDLVKAKKCSGCCNVGAVLFEGEKLKRVPAGVKVIGRKVTDCLREDGCPFDDDDKPLLCMLAPGVAGRVSEFSGKRAVTHADDDSTLEASGCSLALNLPAEFREKVRTVIGLLIEANVWDVKNGHPFPPASADEVVVLCEYHGISAFLSRTIRNVVDLFS